MENEKEKKDIFGGIKGLGKGFKQVLGLDEIEKDEDEDTGIVSFSSEKEDINESKEDISIMNSPKKPGKGIFSRKTTKKEREDIEDDSIITGAYQTIFSDPKNFEDCKKIANYLKQDKMITLNLEYLDIRTAQRLMDFLAGAMKVKGANFVEISKKVFTIVPQDMKVYYEGKNNKERNILKFEREEKN